MPCPSHLGLQSHKNSASFFIFLKTHASGKIYVPLEENIFMFYKTCPPCVELYLQCFSHSLIHSIFFLQVFVLIVGVICSLSLKEKSKHLPQVKQKHSLTASVFQYEIFLLIPNCLKSIHNVFFLFKKKTLRKILKASSKKKCF